MELPLGFLMRITKATTVTQRGVEKMFIVIRRPYAYLEEELSTEFRGQEDVRVMVDRRIAERRKRRQQVSLERRQADRRGTKEELVHIVLLD